MRKDGKERCMEGEAGTEKGRKEAMSEGRKVGHRGEEEGLSKGRYTFPGSVSGLKIYLYRNWVRAGGLEAE